MSIADCFLKRNDRRAFLFPRCRHITATALATFRSGRRRTFCVRLVKRTRIPSLPPLLKGLVKTLLQ
jgi:hypothetical protein